ncbi:MAG TPA: adenylate/guanylate cyclase domain-containing protein [Candidatus Wallbacteria bacterium]|nr:adenylate/guanylate cyclase domain-containing protein [Candidatus Wallbacteria bacterium]
MSLGKVNANTSASADRLNKLMRERLKPGADKKLIDERIWDLFGEEWAVMFTDLSGFSRGVEKFGIIHFLQTIYESERLLLPLIENFDGILLKVEGDSLLVIFRNVNKAVRCALEMQGVLKKYNETQSDEEKILLCVGIGFGRVLKIGDSDVFGAEVNAASKLGEDMARAYEILVTQAVVDKISPLPAGLEFEKIARPPAGARQAYRLIY